MTDDVFERAVPSCKYRDAISTIILDVASEAGIQVRDLLGRSRRPEYAHPRQYAMWLARRDTGASLPQIGRFFGRDHTTVIHAIRAVETRIQSRERN